ncbi:MAG: agmatinase [Candidatus Aminicenantes bacterium]|nr:agmatinase [Candidatus Aminicenantes bacterium]MDH5384540.1 agmatinase [Candidatus Aminicenantes bacterium]MDH5742292.1 agmatinase [Candidatus Aminicenantes bacterium]
MTDFGGSIKKVQEYEFAILGIPFDGKSCYLRGAAKGPEAIREASTGKAINPWTESGVNLEDETVIADLGDLDVMDSFEEIFSRTEQRVLEILKKEAMPIVLGGDHSISYPIVRAFSRKYANLDVLHFDAHPDLYEELYGDRYSHACPFARIMEEGWVENLLQVGIRAATGQQREMARKHRVRMIEMKDIKQEIDLDFSNPLYISFDMDALDPAFAPGVSHHEPGGLSTRQVIDMIHALNAQIVGLDVVELNPDRDNSGITSAAAVKIIMEIIGKTVSRRRPAQKEVS